MINFRLRNLVQFLETFRTQEKSVIGDLQECEYGKFGWIMNPEDSKIAWGKTLMKSPEGLLPLPTNP